MFELRDRPGVVYKAYRSPQAPAALRSIVGWPVALSAQEPALGRLLGTATAWPSHLVMDRAVGGVAGVLMPRAPARFNVVHRDGSAHLATLSYLAAEPTRRSIAYGVRLPAPYTDQRLALVYALARVLDACQRQVPGVGHGDLSNKNILWSFERGPEVYLIDCDNSELFGPDGRPTHDRPRRRAMTPNWEDPAVAAGANPDLASDRYSLGLVFLRVFAAAHFPIQGRQKDGERITVDFELPRGLRALDAFGRRSPLWDLCGASLSVSAPRSRPSPAEWCDVLEGLLSAMGAERLVERVRQAQDGRPRAGGKTTPAVSAVPARLPASGRTVAGAGPAAVSPVPLPAPGPLPGAVTAFRGASSDVVVRPVAALPRVVTWTAVPGLSPDATGAARGAAIMPGAPGAIGGRGAFSAGAVGAQRGGAANLGSAGTGGSRAAAASSVAAVPAGPLGPTTASVVSQQVRQFLRRSMRAWIRAHRQMARLLTSPGRRGRGLRRLVFLAAADFAGACVGLFVVGVFISPFLGL